VSDSVDDTPSFCKHVNLDSGPGAYFLHVGATSWTSWSVTVDPG